MLVRLKRPFFDGATRYPVRQSGVEISDGTPLPPDALVWDGNAFVSQKTTDPKQAAKASQKEGALEPEPDVVSAEMYREKKLEERLEGRDEIQKNEDVTGTPHETQQEETKAREFKEDQAEERVIEEKAKQVSRDRQVEARVAATVGAPNAPQRSTSVPTEGRSEPSKPAPKPEPKR